MSRELDEAIREALSEEMRRDPKVFVLGEDVGAYGGAFGVTQGLHEEFGDMRVVDTPISESAIVGVSIGAALRGYRPVAEMQFADFISCSFDQIVNQAATLRYRYGGRASVPIVVRAPSGGNVGGGLYHSQNPEAWFVHRPGLKVVAPSTAYDAKGLLKAAIRDDNPVVYMEHKYLYRREKGPVPEGDEIVPIGEAAVRREGGDVTVITYGAMVAPSLEASDRLAKEGVEVEVIDLRTLSPFDKPAIFRSLDKTSRALIVHEDVKTLGIGAELSAVIMEEKFDALDAPVLRVTYPDSHVPFSHVLEAANLPNADKLPHALRRVMAVLIGLRGRRCAKNRGERIFETLVAERKAFSLRFRRHRALPREQQRIRHLTEQQLQREPRCGHERGPVQRVPERARERSVGHRRRRGHVQRPGDPARQDRPAHHCNPVRQVDPRVILAARPEPPADTKLERRQHLGKRSATALEHESGPNQHDARSIRRALLRPHRLLFPLYADSREEIRTWARRLSRDIVAERPVVADR